MAELKRVPIPSIEQPIKIAILAMGGEGGGVLADWLVELAKRGGYTSQMTSVPGVAQRTGATIYYLELFRLRPEHSARQPIFALMPGPGDVDIVIASELMEAGRAVQRGLVTSDRTTLIASTHRVYSMTEKMAMGDGRVDSGQLKLAINAAARRLVSADFAKLAGEHATVISAPLFGALAGSGALPFERELFEKTIRASGVGVKASLSAFEAAFVQASRSSQSAGASGFAADTSNLQDPLARRSDPAASQSDPMASQSDPMAGQSDPLGRLGPRLEHLLPLIRSDFNPAVHATIAHALIRLADYQDTAYAEEFLMRLGKVAVLDKTKEDALLLGETARHLALWMSYEDTIRVADLKTRSDRFKRVADEQGLQNQQLLQIREFMHPRVEEIADTLPAPWGRALLANNWLRRFVERFTRNGRVVHTSSIRGFLMLHAIARLRRWRRSSLRFSVEHAHIAIWLQTIESLAANNYALAVEFAKTQGLVKGYGDTHSRGIKNYGLILAKLPSLRQLDDAPVRLRRLTEAALADESGSRLAALLTTL